MVVAVSRQAIDNKTKKNPKREIELSPTKKLAGVTDSIKDKPKNRQENKFIPNRLKICDILDHTPMKQRQRLIFYSTDFKERRLKAAPKPTAVIAPKRVRGSGTATAPRLLPSKVTSTSPVGTFIAVTTKD